MLSIFTADCLHHPIPMAGVETIQELHTLTVINSCVHDQSQHLCYQFIVQFCFNLHLARILLQTDRQTDTQFCSHDLFSLYRLAPISRCDLAVLSALTKFTTKCKVHTKHYIILNDTKVGHCHKFCFAPDWWAIFG